MNQIISQIQNIRPRQILTTVFLGLTLLIGTAFSSHLPVAIATPLSTNNGSASAPEQMPGSYLSRPSIEGRDSQKYSSQEEQEFRDEAFSRNTGDRLRDGLQKTADSVRNATTPEASSYEVEGTDFSADVKSTRHNSPVGSSDLQRDVKQNLRDAADNVRETLNLKD